MRQSIAFVIILIVFAASSAAQSGQSSQVTPNNQTGLAAYNTYAGDHENVNLGTGDLNIVIPLVILPGRNHHDLNVSLLYDSHQYELATLIDPFYGYMGHYWSSFDSGWRVNFPRLGKSFRCDSVGDIWDT